MQALRHDARRMSALASNVIVPAAAFVDGRCMPAISAVSKKSAKPVSA